MLDAMDALHNIPEWLGTALAGAAGGIIGWTVNLFASSRRRVKDREEVERQRISDRKIALRGRLVELSNLLHLTRSAFDSQRKLRDELMRRLEGRNPEDRMIRRLGNIPSEGYENYSLRMAPKFNQSERDMHSIIRGITVSALHTHNKILLDWIHHDDYFGRDHAHEPALAELGLCLVQLRSHLLVWLAKYDAWIGANPDHALVYLADEEQHGAGFPREIEAQVKKVMQLF